MGVDADAARAAALLARACLGLDRSDEAEALATESEALGGDDLKTAIAWRAARSQILSRRGEHDEARRLAQAAVDLAAKTDALVDHGEACVALAIVCRAAGDAEAARRAEEQAALLFVQKGASALLDQLGVDAAVASSASASPQEVVVENRALLAAAKFSDAYGDQRWSDLERWLSSDTVFEDKRPGLQSRIVGREAVMEVLKGIADVGGVEVSWEPVAVRGERFVLIRGLVRGVGDVSFEAQILQIQEIDADDLFVLTLILDPDDVEGAILELDERYRAAEGSLRNACTDVVDQVIAHFLDRDWEGLGALYSEDFFVESRRPGLGHEAHGPQGSIEGWEAAADVGATRVERSVLAVRGDRLSLVRMTFRDDDPSPDGFQMAVLFVNELDDDTKIARAVLFDGDDVETALTELDALATGSAPENAATRTTARFMRAFERKDWKTLRTLLADDHFNDDRRTAIGGRGRGGDRTAEMYKMMSETLGLVAMRYEVTAVRGDRLCLCHGSVLDVKGNEIELRIINEVDADDRICLSIYFDFDAADEALASLDERFAETGNGR